VAYPAKKKNGGSSVQFFFIGLRSRGVILLIILKYIVNMMKIVYFLLTNEAIAKK